MPKLVAEHTCMKYEGFWALGFGKGPIIVTWTCENVNPPLL